MWRLRPPSSAVVPIVPVMVPVTPGAARLSASMAMPPSRPESCASIASIFTGASCGVAPRRVASRLASVAVQVVGASGGLPFHAPARCTAFPAPR